MTEREKLKEMGEVVVTKDELGMIVAVTRQDKEGRVLSVIAESAPHQNMAIKLSET